MISLRRTAQRMKNSTHSYPQHQMEVSGQPDAAVTLPVGENASGTQWIGDWVIPTGSLDAAKEKYLALSGKKSVVYS